MWTILKAGTERVIALGAACLRISLTVAIAVMLACIVIQVVMRYVFGRTPSWTEELAVYMFAWTTMGGLALGVREGFHVRLDILLNWLPGITRPGAERIIDALTAGFGAYLLWSGMRFYEMTGGSVSAAVGYPIEILHVQAPIAGGLIFLFALWRLVSNASPEPAGERTV